MTRAHSLAEMLVDAVDVVDLTQPLSEDTPVLQLPAAVRQHAGPHAPRDQPLRRPRARLGVVLAGDRRARRHALRRADPLGHRPGRRGRRLGAAGAARRPRGRDRQVRRGGRGPRLPADRRRPARVRGRARARCPRAAGCCCAPAGTPARTTRPRSSTPTRPARTRPGFDVECARWLARRAGSSASASRRSAPTRAPRTRFDPPFPVHNFVLGAGRYGLTQLANLARLPPTGAVLIVAPLKLVGGHRQPRRVLALVPRTAAADPG